MKKRSILILVVLLAIGFAAVSTTLIINGTIGIAANKDDFNIIFTNAKLNNVERKDFIDPETKQTITFETNKLTKVDEEAVLDYEVTNTSKLYDGDVKIVCNLIDKDDNIIEDYEYIGIEYEPKSMTVEAGKKETGSITAKLKKAATEDGSVKLKCRLDATAKERDELPTTTKTTTPTTVTPPPTKECTLSDPTIYTFDQWKLRDNDCSGDITKDDLITVGSESFNVLNVKNDTVKALAQFNLYVGNICESSGNCKPLEDPTGLQDYRAHGYYYAMPSHTIQYPFIGGVPYTTEEKYNAETAGMASGSKPPMNDYSISLIKEYVDAYAVKLAEMNAQADEVRLLEQEDYDDLGCNFPDFCNQLKERFLTGFSFWTTVAYSFAYSFSSPTNQVWIYNSDTHSHSSNVTTKNTYGVRPVIEVSKSLFE